MASLFVSEEDKESVGRGLTTMTFDSSVSSCSIQQRSHVSTVSSGIRKSSSKISKASHKKSVSFSKGNTKSMSGSHGKNRYMTPAERAVMMKQSRRHSRKQSLQGECEPCQQQDAYDERTPTDDVPPEVKVGRDDATMETYTTFHSGTQISAVTNHFSVASTNQSECESCGGADIALTWCFTEGVHDRIRYELETASSKRIPMKGSRLSHLIAAQNGSTEESAPTVCGTKVPRILQGTYNRIKERFRSESVEEVCGDSVDSTSETACSRMPSQEELARYANRAKMALLDTIEALEKLRVTSVETLGPAVERLKQETEACLIHSGVWCRANYIKVEKSASEVQSEVIKVMQDLCISSGFSPERPLDPPDDDISVVQSGSMAEENDFSRQADQALLKSLRVAASVFLERYAAFVSSFSSPGSTKVETKVALLDFPNDDEPEPEPETDKKCRSFTFQKGIDFAVESALENAQSLQESKMTQKAQEAVAFDQVDMDVPREPDGVLLFDDCSVEPSIAHVLGLDEATTNLELTQRNTFTSLGRSTFTSVNSHESTHSQTYLQVASASGDHICSEDQDDEIPNNEFTNGRFHSNDPPDSSVGNPRIYNDTEAERLERESASIWKKLRKLSKKKRMAAASMLDEFIDGIDHSSASGASSRKREKDNVSLGTQVTQGTFQNPISLLEGDDGSDGRKNQPVTSKRQQGSVSLKSRGSVSLKSRESRALLAFDDSSEVSGLTTLTGLTNRTMGILSTAAVVDISGSASATAERDIQARSGSSVAEFRDPPKDDFAEAAEDLLSSLQTHLRDRHKSHEHYPEELTPTMDLRTSRKNSPPMVTNDLHRADRQYSQADNPIFPYDRSSKSYSKKIHHSRHYKTAKQIMADLQEPLVLSTQSDNNLLPVQKRSADSPVELPGYPLHTTMKKLLADPNRNAMIGNWPFAEPRPRTITGRKKLLADPNRHAMVGGTKWDPIPIDLSLSIDSRDPRARVEERDDRHAGVRAIEAYERDGRLPAVRTDSGMDVFRIRPIKIQDSFSETKSVSSCLSKNNGIPKRSKSVSFNLPDDDEVTATPFKFGGGPWNRDSSRSAHALAQRSAIARRELARLSQRQASEMAKGNNLFRIPIKLR